MGHERPEHAERRGRLDAHRTPDQTGYLKTSAGQAYYNSLTSEEKKAFGMREMDYINYGTPRQIRLGCRLSF